MTSGTSRLGLGRLAYQLYYRPLGAVRQSLREGGPLEQYRDRLGRQAMIAAAGSLPPMAEPPAGPPAEVFFVSGPKYWYQTLFCFVSLQLQVPFRVTPVILDDGAMDAATRERLLRVVPWMRFVCATESEARLDALLPESRFPSLRARRRGYPHLRKLTDIHVGSDGFRLVADSDMLFFAEPTELIEWFKAPHPFYMRDVETAYGYALPFLGGLAGAEVPEAVNVGLYGIDGSQIDWNRVECWCDRQLAAFGPQYVQEQALTAMLFAGRQALELPRDRYIVMPDDAEGREPNAVLHHYVDTSKRSYFRHGWNRIDALAHARSGLT